MMIAEKSAIQTAICGRGRNWWAIVHRKVKKKTRVNILLKTACPFSRLLLLLLVSSDSPAVMIYPRTVMIQSSVGGGIEGKNRGGSSNTLLSESKVAIDVISTHALFSYCLKLLSDSPTEIQCTVCCRGGNREI